NLSWLRGTKTSLDNVSEWAVVGEQITGLADQPYYVSHFNVPPTAELSPLSGTVLRGTNFEMDASGTYDPDNGDTIQYTWSVVPESASIIITPNGNFAELFVDRNIGGAEVPVSVSVVAVDYSGNPPTPNH